MRDHMLASHGGECGFTSKVDGRAVPVDELPNEINSDEIQTLLENVRREHLEAHSLWKSMRVRHNHR